MVEPAIKGSPSVERLSPVEGAAKPGDYVTIVIYGVAPVRINSLSSDILPGTRLVVDQDGQARALQTVEVEGISVAESAPTIGIALEQPDSDSLVWVLVNPQ